MFDKSINDIKKADIQTTKLYKDNGIFLSISFIAMMNNEHINEQLKEKLDYQNTITSYINRKHEYNIKKQYNNKIIDLYHNGIIVINNEEYQLKDFFIVFDDKRNNFNIKCLNPKYKAKIIEYNKAVRFIDTTAFISLIDKANVINNKIVIDNSNILDNVVKNWNGFLHSEVLETDAITNKKIIKDDKNE